MAVPRPRLVSPNGQILASESIAGPDYHVVRPHGSRDWLLMHTLDGHGRIRSPKGEAVLTKGMAVLYPAGCPHDYGTAAGAKHGPSGFGTWSFQWAHFLPRDCWHDILSWPIVLGGPGLLTVHSAHHMHIVHQMALMIASSRSPGKRDDQLAMSALEVTLLLFDRANAGSGVAVDPRVMSAMSSIQKDPHIATDIPRLSRIAGLSPSRFAHLFRAGAGMSPGRWAELVRLRSAASQLLSTNDPVGTIAASVGYPDPMYFSSRFRKRFGTSPRDYRARGR